EINDKRLYGSGFVGVKLIGNPTNKGTRWNYTISCSGTLLAEKPSGIDTDRPLGIDRWWGEAGQKKPVEVTWTVEILNEEAGEYELDIDVFRKNSWNLATGSKIIVDNNRKTGFDNEFLGKKDIGYLAPGKHTIKINGFLPPSEPVIEQITFNLNGSKGKKKSLKALFIADRKNADNLTNLSTLTNKYLSLAEKYAPVLYFDKGNERENLRPEDYPMPFDISSTWNEKDITFSGSSDESIDLSTYPDKKQLKEVCKSPSTIYASISTNSSEIAINYYFHYPRSNWKSYGGFNTHQGDWEGVVLFLGKNDKKPRRVSFSQHLKTLGGFLSKGGVTVPFEYLDKGKTGFNVYVGLGAHASFPFRGISKFGLKNEYHKGDFNRPCGITSNVEIIPHLGILPSHFSNYEESKKYRWLTFPGKWGIEEDNGTGDDPPRGPVFLKASSGKIDPGDENDLGVRWFNPWKWSSKFSKIKKGYNSFGKVNHQVIYIGTEGNDDINVDEARSILRGKGGNDTYKLESGNPNEDSSATFIEDSGGEKDKLIFDGVLGINRQVDLSGLQKGKRGLYRGQDVFNGTALLIDFNRDGKARFIDDVVILDFFEKRNGSLVRGKGFIETIGDLKASEIDKFFNLK
ncbi:MAG: hypothetical protein AAF551_12415, partial [Bacteroidota bacterium]